MGNTMKKNIGLLAFPVVISFFYLFVYNSGYGYDALEYYVIGRSLTDGYSFYAFIPSRSWALYHLVALFFSWNIFLSRYAISLLITAVYAAILLLTYFVVRKRSNRGCALVSSFLVGVCGIFMELNFLLSTGFVFLTGLVSFHYITKNIRRPRKKDLLLGGIWVGVGFAFKSVALFYFAAIVIFLAFWQFFKVNNSIKTIIKQQAYFFLGFFLAFLLPLAYFFLTSRIADYLKWTFYFPVLRFPSDTEWLYKIYTKLLWFPILMALTFLFSLRPKIKKIIYSDPVNILLIFIGIFSLLPLFKSQASHYLFPGAAFLSIYVSKVWFAAGKHFKIMGNKAFVLSIVIFVISTMAVSATLYNPLALKRLITFRDYSGEKKLKVVLQEYVAEGKKVIFFSDSMYLYWISERYPNIPFVHFDVQAEYGLRESPHLLLDALRDPNLVLVEFNPKFIQKEGESYFRKGGNERLIRNFYQELQKYFIEKDIDELDYVFWVRRDSLK